jgi:hypothetical protein
MDFKNKFKNRIKKNFIIFSSNLIEILKKMNSNYINPPHQIVYINPSNVNYRLKKTNRFGFKKTNRFGFKKASSYLNRMCMTGRIIGGDWDLNVEHIEKHVFYNSFKYFLQQGTFFNSDIHRKFIDLKDSIALKKEFKGTNNWEDYEKRHLKKWLNIYNSIKEEGYKTQSTLGNINPFKEIEVAISRNGEIIFVDGIHRLTFAKVLKLQKIPVIIKQVHINAIIDNKFSFKG